jgi:hypothetical protein
MPTTAELPRPAGGREAGVWRAVTDMETFGEVVLRMPLRPYQLQVARAVLASIGERRGLTFTVMMAPRGYGDPRAARQIA